MSWVRSLLGAFALLLLGQQAYAQSGCIPNPNLGPWAGTPAFVNGCPITAAGLNLLAPLNAPTFTAPMTIQDSKILAFTTDGFSFSVLSQNTYTANQIYRMSTAAAVTNFDTVRSVGANNTLSTVTNVTQFAAYQVNNNTLGAGVNTDAGVLYFGVGVAAANGSAEWGLNPVLVDNTTYAISAGTGKILQNEFDFNVTSPSTIINGLFVAGASLSQPTLANGFRVRPLGTGILWTNGFTTDDGTATNALTIGAAAAAAPNVASQFLLFRFFDGASAMQSYNVRANAVQQFELSSTIGSAAAFLVDGLTRTPDSATYVNAFEAGALAASGTNIASAAYLWHYFNGAGTSLLVSAKVTTAQVLAFTGASSYSVDQSFASPLFVGNGVNGVSCAAGVPSSSFTVSGGIVTHC